MQRDSLNGLIAAALAYAIWGVVVIYWKLLDATPAWEVLAHRVVWCFVFLTPFIVAGRRASAIARTLASWRRLAALMLSAVLITMNWGLFIWAVQEGRILETSLGYYINPLLSILIGVAVLGERLSRWRIAAFALAGLGVAIQAVALGGLPWVSLVLAASFAVYGYVRKVVSVQALDGLFIETLLTAPFALVYLLMLAGEGRLVFGGGDMTTTLLLIGAGPLTAIPLWMFAVGARGVRMSTMGFLQYITPTLTLLIAVFVYREPFDLIRAVSFAFIWAALAVVAVDTLRPARVRLKAA